eukprot:353467-Chlamydomonas_euryale.AAC.1
MSKRDERYKRVSLYKRSRLQVQREVSHGDDGKHPGDEGMRQDVPHATQITQVAQCGMRSMWHMLCEPCLCRRWLASHIIHPPKQPTPKHLQHSTPPHPTCYAALLCLCTFSSTNEPKNNSTRVRPVACPTAALPTPHCAPPPHRTWYTALLCSRTLRSTFDSDATSSMRHCRTPHTPHPHAAPGTPPCCARALSAQRSTQVQPAACATAALPTPHTPTPHLVHRLAVLAHAQLNVQLRRNQHRAPPNALFALHNVAVDVVANVEHLRRWQRVGTIVETERQLPNSFLTIALLTRAAC